MEKGILIINGTKLNLVLYTKKNGTRKNFFWYTLPKIMLPIKYKLVLSTKIKSTRIIKNGT